jgi:replicative DNA helicase
MMRKIVPPHSVDAELACMAVGLRSADAMVDFAAVMSADDFYDPRHRLIAAAMLDVFGGNRPVDMITVSQKLMSGGDIQRAGGAEYVAGITDCQASPGNIMAYVETVKEKAKARRLISECGLIIDRGYIEDDVDGLLSDAEMVICSIGNDTSKSNFVDVRAMVPGIMDRLNNRINNPGKAIGLSTGYVDLDKITCGLNPADLIILAGRPSMGKTAFALNILKSVSVENHLPAAMFSLEMSRELLGDRLLCAVSKVNSQKIRTGYLQDSDYPKLDAGFERLRGAPIFLDDSGDISVSQMRAKARRLKNRHPDLALVVVDYLQLMRGKGDNRNLELSDISRSLKLMAKDLNVPVMALSQLNRELEKRNDKRPIMSDLRESGAIEQDADLIMFLYRDEVYNKSPDNPRRGVTEVIIGKQRNGPVGTVELIFQGEHSLFLNKVA